MGCSIILIGPRGGQTNITPGWRTKMHGIITREFGRLVASGIHFTRDDSPKLRQAAMQQCKGESPPPFDWSEEIYDSFHKIIGQVEKHGGATVEITY